MNLGLKQKLALVLGGGGGLGRAISIALAKEGASVAFADIEPTALAGTESALTEIGGKGLGIVWDLADLSQIDPNVSKIESELGPVDILVNITGGPPPTPASGQDPTLWSKHFQSMVLSVIAITEFTESAQQASSINYDNLETYLALAVGYLVLTIPISLWSRGLEQRFKYET